MSRNCFTAASRHFIITKLLNIKILGRQVIIIIANSIIRNIFMQVKNTIQTKSIILNSYKGPQQFKEIIQELSFTPSNVVIKMLCFSVDPVMKFWATGAKTYYRSLEIGDIFNCFGLGIVIQGN